jgi:hypothetical protein
MATLLNPFLRALDANADSVSGGLLYVFEAGTTTPVTTYSDRAMATAQAQPLVANAAGEFEQVFVASGTYKIRVADSGAVVLYENDYVRMADRPDDPVFFDTDAEIIADTTTYAAGTYLQAETRFEVAASGAADHDTTNAGGAKLYIRSKEKIFSDVTAVLADTAAWYPAGFHLRSVEGGFVYEVAAPGATDQHLTTAGGVGLYALRGEGGYDVQQFGESGGGVSSDTGVVQEAIDVSKEYAETLNFPKGEYLVSGLYVDKSQLNATSKGAVLKADAGATVVCSFGRHDVDWDWYGVQGLTFDGNSKASDGVDFEDDTSGFEYLGGRWSFERCNFKYSLKGAHHKSGNIGNRFRDCNFAHNDFGAFHIDERSAGVMHSGASFYQGCEFNSNALAAVYINDATDGLGQYTFDNTIIEGNPGFGIFMDLNGITPFCGVVLDTVWFEANASAGSVTIDGVSYTPHNVRIKDASPVTVRNCTIYDWELVNSTVIADGCRIDDAVGAKPLIIDSTSNLICTNVFMNGQGSDGPFVESIASNAKASGVTTNCSVRGPLRTHKAPANASVVYQNNFDGVTPGTFLGTGSVAATSVSDGVIHDACAELVVPDGYTLVSPDSGTATAGKWAVWSIHAKLVSGELGVADLGGGGTKFGNIYLRTGEWVCSYGVGLVDASPTLSRMRFINSSGAAATVRFGDVFVIEFDTESEAVNFCNSRAIYK